MTETVDIIVLGQTKFKDNSIILHTLTKGYGRRGYIVRLRKGESMSKFLPFNILEAESFTNSKSTSGGASNLGKLSNISMKSPLFGIRGDVFKNTITLFLSELLFRVVKDGTDEEGLFPWCVKQIMILDALESDYSNFHLRFLLEFAAILGFSPEYENLRPFVGRHSETIRQFLTLPYEDTMLIQLNGEVRNEIATSLIKYLEFHTESSIQIRSLAVLRDLFA